MSAVDDLIAELNAYRISPAPQPVQVSIDKLEAGLNLLQDANVLQQSGAVAVTPGAAGFKMAGLAAQITPVKSGTVLVIVSGFIVTTSAGAGAGCAYQLSFGTGAPPANGDALTGTQVGSQQTYTNPAAVTAADVNMPFSIQAVITGLATDVPVWLDLAQKILTANGTGFKNVNVTAVEL